MAFADRLRELRQQAKLSQSELAQASGVPAWTIRGYEQGRREPQWDVLFKLTRAMGVSCERFADCVPSDASEANQPTKKKRGRPKKA